MGSCHTRVSPTDERAPFSAFGVTHKRETVRKLLEWRMVMEKVPERPESLVPGQSFLLSNWKLRDEQGKSEGCHYLLYLNNWPSQFAQR